MGRRVTTLSVDADQGFAVSGVDTDHTLGKIDHGR